MVVDGWVGFYFGFLSGEGGAGSVAGGLGDKGGVAGGGEVVVRGFGGGGEVGCGSDGGCCCFLVVDA